MKTLNADGTPDSSEGGPVKQDRKKYKQRLRVGPWAIPKRYRELHTWLLGLARQLNCTVLDLIWLAIHRLQADPPTEEPFPRQRFPFHSPGYWVQVVRNDARQPVGIVVREVVSRFDATGHVFYRFLRCDTEGRQRALQQAIAKARLVCEATGLRLEQISVEEFAAGPAATEE